MSDRRDPTKQRMLEGGERAGDPPLEEDWLTTRQCAERLGVTTTFVIGEIRDARLAAMVIERPGLRTIYRIRPSALAAYITRYQWTTPSAPAPSAK